MLAPSPKAHRAPPGTPPSLTASPISLRPARVATGRPPEPFSSSASSSTLRPVPSPFRDHASVALPCADHPPTPSCLLLEVPLRRFSVRSVHSRSRIETRDLRPPRATERVSFRPRGFSPPRRFSPERRREHCCSPLPTLGFTVFLRPDPLHPSAPERASWPAGPCPSPRCTPPLEDDSLPAVPPSLTAHPKARVHAKALPP
jgi:hypothetical protein